MQPNPFLSLLKSRKFLLMVLDLIISFATYFITKYVAPELSNDILYVLGGLQPVIIVVIGAIAYEDAAKTNAAVWIEPKVEEEGKG